MATEGSGQDDRARPAKPIYTNITVRVLRDVKDEAKAIAEQNGEGLTDIVQRAFAAYIKHHSRPEPHDVEGRPTLRPVHRRRRPHP